jgi:hypothetical protein
MLVRLESPGRDFATERELLAAGAEAAAAEGSSHLPARDALALEFDRGRIWFPRQWYLGFRTLLRMIARQLAEAPPHRLWQSPGEVAALFDKPRCQQRLALAGVPVPNPLGPAAGFDEIQERMRTAPRAFLKSAHGSSASGVAALHHDRGRLRAVTTTEIVRTGGEIRFYDSRGVRAYRRAEDVRDLIDAICANRARLEAWRPKAVLDGQPFDLRVVAIGGREAHVVVRTGPGPMTDLHLGNRRGDSDRLRARMEGTRWEDAMAVCRRAAAAFPGCWHLGIDLLLEPGFRRPQLLEANAFGDLLPSVPHDGDDTYTAELRRDERLTGCLIREATA